MHVHCLHWLMSTGLFSRVCFVDHVNPRLAKWYLAPTVNACLSRPCNGILALCGYMYKHHDNYDHGYSKLYCLCHVASLFKLLLPPTPRAPSTHPFIYIDPILTNSMKKCQKLAKSAII